MDPYVEQRLRDEVRFLHSLWRRGPPNTTPLIIPSETLYIATGSEQPTRKKSGAGKKQKRKKKMMMMTQMDDENEEKRKKVSDLGWTCMEPRVEAEESGTEWPAFKAKSDQAVDLTLEEKATMSARKVQQRGVEASRMFFARNTDVGSDGEFESEDESENEDEDESESEEFKFFRKLFEEDEGLRGYYEKNWIDGEFSCLVCRGNGEKVTKKFKNCVAVVQHSVTISRTHKKRAHRAYGEVICNLLKWDINKLPADALPVGDQGGEKLVESEVGETIVLQDHGLTGGWDAKWKIDKRPTCTSEWGQFSSERDLVSERELTEEEKRKVAAAKLQERSLETARAFFSRDEFVDSDSEGEDENDMDSNESDECEEYKFLVKLFEEEQELRDYYKRSWGSGAFSCLVCWGNVEKLNKRYKDCVALVQHCVSISKTKRKIAHRAYGEVICNLLKWDINKLPADALPVGDQGGEKLVESEVGETIVLQDHGLTSGWDAKWNIDKRPTCTSEWGQFSSQLDLVSERELTEEEKRKVAAAKLQERSREAARAFFSQDEFVDSDSEGEDENDMDSNESDECEEYKFLVKLFAEDQDLRDYYKRSWGSGAFSCLVCWGNVEKLNKRYKDCVALVQHCVSISRTKRKIAHRAYGKLICELLSWDISRLPANELPVVDVLRPISSDFQVDESVLEIASVAKVSESQEEPQENLIEEKNSRQCEEPKKDSSWEEISEKRGGSANTVSTNELGWALFNSSASQNPTKELTMAEKSKLNSMKVHQKSLDATRAFFSKDGGLDSDGDFQEEEEEEEESEKDDLNAFFTSLLEESGELMGYYQTNWENGEFSCLVCGGAGENLTKKFKNLVAVVQHSVTIGKSKRIRAHRVYGQVICKKLNWDINRLPVISSPPEDNPGPALPNCQVFTFSRHHCVGRGVFS
ncbi:unnamed protein product [Rhodiola kirilowii]